MRFALVLVAVALVACKPKPDAAAVCSKLEAAKVAAHCVAGQVGGLGSAAREKVDFDLPSVPGEKGQVLVFSKAEDFDATVKAFDAAAVLAGRHRYGSRSALVFVQLNAGASEATGQAAKAVVDAL